jgi:predicted enzyme related to lactoylglutathione lyase
MSKIRYEATLLSVADMERAVNFYTSVLDQKIYHNMDNINIVFESGIALILNLDEFLNDFGASVKIKDKPNNIELVFVVDDFDSLVEKISAIEGIEVIHDVSEYFPGGMRVFRFYDYDGHIIELDESESDVAKRLLAEGASIDEIADATFLSVEEVKELIG